MFIMQVVIFKIMKTLEMMKHASLMDEVINQSQSRLWSQLSTAESFIEMVLLNIELVKLFFTSCFYARKKKI